MKVEDDHANKYGTLHGGMTATLVDNISTLALVSVEGGAPGVSVDMNITYVSKLYYEYLFLLWKLISNNDS